MLKTEIEIENLPAGPEFDFLIAEEIFDAIPLSDPEFEIFKATWLLARGPHDAQAVARPVKIPSDEINFHTKLDFYLDWPKNVSAPEWEGSAVVRQMRLRGWLYDITDFETSEGKIIKQAGFQKGTMRGEASADTDALAVCRAAVLAIREEKKLNEWLKSEPSKGVKK